MFKISLFSVGFGLVFVTATAVYFLGKDPNKPNKELVSSDIASSNLPGPVKSDTESSDRVSQEKPAISYDKKQDEPNIVAINKEVERAQAQLIKNQLTADLIDDLIAADRPLSNFCSSLSRANDEVFANKKSFRDIFKKSIAPDEADPRVQSVKPILRYVLRLPEVTNILRIAQTAWENDDKSPLKTFNFFQKALVAFAEINEHREEIQLIMDRSYLLFNLNKIGAKNRELLKDSRVFNYCEKIELAFNQARPVSFEEEKKDFMNFMSEVGVGSEQIDFDANYKSSLKLGINRETVTMEGGWVKDLILPDGKNF